MESARNRSKALLSSIFSSIRFNMALTDILKCLSFYQNYMKPHTVVVLIIVASSRCTTTLVSKILIASLELVGKLQQGCMCTYSKNKEFNRPKHCSMHKAERVLDKVRRRKTTLLDDFRYQAVKRVCSTGRSSL